MTEISQIAHGKMLEVKAYPQGKVIQFTLYIHPTEMGKFRLGRWSPEENSVLPWGPAVGLRFVTEEHAMNWLESRGWKVEKI